MNKIVNITSSNKRRLLYITRNLSINMNNSNEKLYFQDSMSDNVCFGCGTVDNNPNGLHIKSYWSNEPNIAICKWKCRSEEEAKTFSGWKGLLNGGILSTLIDCHCMNTAMAAAYQLENRSLNSTPIYRYATGTMNIKYLKPTPNNCELEIRAIVQEIKGRKVTLQCKIFANEECTVDSQVIAIRVYDSSKEKNIDAFNQ